MMDQTGVTFMRWGEGLQWPCYVGGVAKMCPPRSPGGGKSFSFLPPPHLLLLNVGGAPCNSSASTCSEQNCRDSAQACVTTGLCFWRCLSGVDVAEACGARTAAAATIVFAWSTCSLSPVGKARVWVQLASPTSFITALLCLLLTGFQASLNWSWMTEILLRLSTTKFFIQLNLDIARLIKSTVYFFILKFRCIEIALFSVQKCLRSALKS